MNSVQLPSASNILPGIVIRSNVDLGFAGRYPGVSIVHRATKRAQPGDELQLVARNNGLELLDRNGMAVGRMSRGFEPVGRLDRARAQVAAVIARTKDDSAPEYQRYMRCERWETVVPALMYEDSSNRGIADSKSARN